MLSFSAFAARGDFVLWPNGSPPTKADLRNVLEDYLRGSGSTIEVGVYRFIVRLPGATSYAFQRSGVATPSLREMWAEDDRTRFFEVAFEGDTTTIILHTPDTLTVAIAYGFYKVLLGWVRKIDRR